MSVLVVAFDGVTCCNCGKTRDAHAADGSCQCPSCGHVRSEHAADGTCPRPAGERTHLDRLDAAGLARGLLSIVEQGAWPYAPDPSGDVRCRACGYLAGYPHHPACGYRCFAARIKAL